MSQIPQIGSAAIEAALIGRPIRAVGDRINVAAYGDAAGQQAQTSVVSIAGAENSSLYSMRIRSTSVALTIDETVSYTTDSGATVAELRDGLIAAVRDNPKLGFLVASIDSDTAALTLNGAANRSFAVTFPANPTTDLTVATTAPGFTQYLYGQAVEVVEPATASPINSRNVRDPSVLGGGTLALTLVTNDDGETSTTVLLRQYADGSVETDTLVVTAGASDALTTAAIVTALETLYPEADVEITTADEVVTATFSAGEQVSIISGPVNTTTLDITAETTAAPEAAPLRLVVDDYSTAPIESRTSATEVLGPVPGLAINCAAPSGSTVWKVDGSSRTLGSRDVYTDANGALYDAHAAGRRLWPEPKWHGTSEANRHALEY